MSRTERAELNEGNMIRREWPRRYDSPPARSPSVHVLQSWDTACKSGEDNDWSVCTTWFVIDVKFYLIDVLRGRFVYPTLKDLAIAHAKLHRPATILIEDSGVGTGLVVELQKGGLPAIAVKVEHNKETRMSIQSGKFAAGHVFFPRQAPWLDELEAELFAFPRSRHDDQVDSISQALSYEVHRPSWDDKSNEGFSKFVSALAMDQYFGWATGRPCLPPLRGRAAPVRRARGQRGADPQARAARPQARDRLGQPAAL